MVFQSYALFPAGRLGEARVTPTLFVMEGGFAVDRLGDNVAGVLLGFEGARQSSAG
jgi:acetoin utilization deacetylase AcuC-like enzyme